MRQTQEVWDIIFGAVSDFAKDFEGINKRNIHKTLITQYFSMNIFIPLPIFFGQNLKYVTSLSFCLKVEKDNENINHIYML